MAELQFPSILGSFLQGQRAGTEQRLLRQDEEKQSRLAQLAGQAYNAQGPERQALVGQAVGVDPRAGFALEGDLQGSEDARTKTLVNAAKLLTTAPEQQRAYLYQQMKPDLARIGLQLPDQYDETVAQTAQAITQAYGGLDKAGQVQSTKIGSDGYYYTVDRTGNWTRSNVQANPSIQILEQEGQLPYGVVKSGGVAGSVVPLGGGAPQGPQAQQTTRFTGPDGQPIQIGDDVPAAVRQQILADPQAWNSAPDGSSAQLPPQQVSAPSAGPVRTPTAAEKAFAAENAKNAANNQNFPNQLAQEQALTDIKTQAQVDADRQKASMERAAAAPAVIATMQTSLDSIDALLKDPDLGSIVGLGSMNPINKLPGTKARGLIARAEQVAGQSFLAAFNQLKGGGAITEREGQAATAAMARLDRSQSEADYRTALRDLKAAIQPAIDRAKQQAGATQNGGGTGSVWTRDANGKLVRGN